MTQPQLNEQFKPYLTAKQRKLLARILSGISGVRDGIYSLGSSTVHIRTTSELAALDDTTLFPGHPLEIAQRFVLSAKNTRFTNDGEHLIVRLDGLVDNSPNFIAVLDVPAQIEVLAVIGTRPSTRYARDHAAVLRAILTGRDMQSLADERGTTSRSARRITNAVAEGMGLPDRTGMEARAAGGITNLLMKLIFEAVSGGQAELEEYRHLFLPREARLLRLNNPKAASQIINVISLGPRGGRPLVTLHAMMPPHLGEEEFALLSELQIELFIPLRNGALAPRVADLSEKEHFEHAIEGVHAVAQELGEKAFHLAASVTSSRIVLEYAKRYPERIAGISMIAACRIEGRPNRGARGLSDALINTLTDLANRWPALSRFILREVFSEDRFSPFIMRHFAGIPADLNILKKEAELAERKFRGENRFRFALANSLPSIRHDLLCQKDLAWEIANELQREIIFYHGTDDLIHPLSLIEDLVNEIPGARIVPIEAGGQLLYLNHFEPIIRDISSRM